MTPKPQGQAGRLLKYLDRHGTATTRDIQIKLDVSNPSELASRLNGRFALASDDRRLICEMQHRERRGRIARVGVWRIARDTPSVAA